MVAWLTLLACQRVPPALPSDPVVESVRAMFGVDFSPFGPGQKPGDRVPESLIRERLAQLAPHIRWVRTFGSQNEMGTIAELARERGLNVAMGAWISRDVEHNERELAALISLGRRGLVDLAIVGSETLYRGDISEAELIVYLRRVRQALPGVPVTSADIYRTLLDSPRLARESDVLLYNSYPYWEGIGIEHAVAHFHERHQRVAAIAGGKPVWVSETGWPSAGQTIGDAVPSLENQQRYFHELRAWAQVHDVGYFWFSSHDEGWKAESDEGAQGAHWGLSDELGEWKFDVTAPPEGSWPEPREVYFKGEREVGGPGDPRLEVTEISPLGQLGSVGGRAVHVRPADVAVAQFVEREDGWWTKPLFDEALTPVWLDGSFRGSVIREGDENAHRIALFLLPKTYTPPLLGGWDALPDEIGEHALDQVVVTRPAPGAP